MLFVQLFEIPAYALTTTTTTTTTMMMMMMCVGDCWFSNSERRQRELHLSTVGRRTGDDRWCHHSARRVDCVAHHHYRS